MTLVQLLEGRFRGDIRFRGAELLRDERVAINRVTAQEVLALVRDHQDFTVLIKREEGRLRFRCGCPQGQRVEAKDDALCKHVWASLLAVDAAGLVQGVVRAGNIPEFLTSQPTQVEFSENWSDEDDDEDLAPLVSQSSKAQALLSRKLRDWDAQLVKLRESLDGSEPVAGQSPARERILYYEIDIGQSRDTGQVIVQVSQRQKRSNGDWGKLKPVRVRSQSIGEFVEADREIVALLCGGVPERLNQPGAEPQAGAARYHLTPALADLVLPKMCETGRCQFYTAEGTVHVPLKWDGGSAWELTLGLALDEEVQKWVLEGRLKRGDDSLLLSETVLVLPGIVFTAIRIGKLRDYGYSHWISLLRRSDAISVNESEIEELIDRLLDMPSLPRLELPVKLRLEELRVDPIPQLTVHTPRAVRWQRERLVAEVKFLYEGNAIRSSSPQGALIQRELNRYIPRDAAAEETAWQMITACGFRKVLDPARSNADVEIPARDLGVAVRQLVEKGWDVRADGHQVRQPGKIQFQVRSNIDWFELHGQVDFGGQSVPFPELLSALARGDSTIRLNDGSLGILPEEWFEKYGLLAGLGTTSGEHLEFQTNQVGLLDALLAAQESVDLDDRFVQLKQQLETFKKIDNVVEPDGFQGKLRDYQRDGLGWMLFLRDYGFGGCLADDMGLGKTVQLLALLLSGKRRGPALVIVPKSLIFNWAQECTTFTPTLRVLEYVGLERESLRTKIPHSDVVLTTYGTLRRDILYLRDVQFDYLVLDEAQAIKNARSQVAKASRLLKGKYRLALSGTPIENHLGDLWSIFEFLNPGMLGRASLFKNEVIDGQDDNSRKLISHALRPFILRRTKREVAGELPDKLEQTIHCEMGEAQSKRYQELREHYRTSLMGLVQRDGIAKSKIHVLEALLRLRQAACHPGLLDQSVIDEPSAKIDMLVWHLEELLSEGHKALVFSQFTSMLAIVRKHLDKKKIVYEYLDGQTRRRKEHVEHFQNDPSVGVFLISLKAGGLGLNLTAADYVFILDPWWNPAVEAQAIDRAHRIGQSRQVFAYRLICRNTVEEKIAQLQVQKRDLAEAILQADNNLVKDLTMEDLDLLLS